MTKNENYFEIITGAFVLLCAGFFLFSSLKSAGLDENSHGYRLIAKFDNVDGITNGSDVKISGVKIGIVESQFLDEKTLRATLRLKVNSSVSLPADSSAKVASEGLLGSKYLAITPGGEEQNLKDGEEIIFTQSSVNFEELLGKFIFNSSSEQKKPDEK